MVRESKREEIVAAALDRFHAEGYNATGVKDITDAAGVPKGSFYNHFESKESLASLVLERYGETRRLDELADGSVDPLDRLRDHFTFLRRENETRDFTRGCMFGNFGAEIVDHSDEIRGSVRQGLDAWARALASTIAEAHDAGAVRADIDPEKTARFLISAWEGALIVARVYRDADAFEAFFDVALGSLIKA